MPLLASLRIETWHRVNRKAIAYDECGRLVTSIALTPAVVYGGLAYTFLAKGYGGNGGAPPASVTFALRRRPSIASPLARQRAAIRAAGCRPFLWDRA
jgi:hypothetical protein